MISPRGCTPPVRLGLLMTLLASLASGSPAAPWSVTSNADSGPGSLRAALEQANARPGDDQIEITVTGEIRLDSELPPVAGNTVLIGPGPDRLRVLGSGKHRLLTFLPGTTNRLSGLTLAGGRLTNGTSGAGLRNQGSLELIDCTLTDHRIEVGMGGAIHNVGDLLLLRCRVMSNSVTGGRGGPGGFGGDGGGGGGLGGGVFSLGGRVVVSNSVFEGNVATGGAGGRAGDNNPYLGGTGGGPEGGAGGEASTNGGKGGLGSGGGGGGHTTGIGGNGGIGGGGGGGGASLPPMPLPGESEFGGGRGGYASLAAGSGNGGGGGGGAGLGAGVFMKDGVLLAVASRWEGNRSEGGPGGGVYAGGQGGGAYGAAVFVQGGSAELRDCLLSRNTAEGASGGGGHHAALGGHAGGGAVFLRQASAALIGCTVVSNLARSGPTPGASRSAREGAGAWGGGLGLYEGYTHLTNCTLSANTIQGGQGGTVYVGEDGGPAWGGGFGAISNAVTLVHCTITLNTALGGDAGLSWPGLNPRGSPGESLGGGFHQTNGVVRLLNTLVAGNSSSTATNRSDGFGPVDSLGPNLFGTAAGLHGLGPWDRVGPDPLLGPLANLGGPTPVHPLVEGSPALDSGAVQGAPGTDQRGGLRPAGSGVDLGAFELAHTNTPRAWILIDSQPVPGGSVQAVGAAAVALESSLPGAPLHYTLDGSEPTPGSPRYDGPFAVIATSTVRATAFPPAGDPGIEAPRVRVVVIPPGLYRLNLTVSGQGRLRVDPPEGPYPAGTRVRITALPDPYWAFAGWTGDADEPFRHTELVMASDRTLQASFSPFPSYPLNLVLDGLGRVDLDPRADTYLSNAVVRLVAREVQNRDTTGYSAFAGWGGDLGGSSPTNQIVMNGPRTVIARFPRTEWNPPRYWVHTTTPGGGDVTVDPAPAPGAYPSNSLVTVRAVIVHLQWQFMHWMGDVEGTNPVHTFRIRKNTRAIAVFGTHPTYRALKTDSVGFPLEDLPTLPRVLQPNHTRFPYGARIRLTVLPPPGTMIGSWLGQYDGPWGVPHAEFESYSAWPVVGAAFHPLPVNRVAFTSTAQGRGRVSSSVPSGNHPIGGSATLTAHPDPGQSFLGWSGDATGTDPVVTVPLNASRTIVGLFTERPTLSWVDMYGDGLPDRFRLQLDATPDSRWILESSTDLATWRPVSTNTAPTGLHVLGIRPEQTGSPAFYRATEAPQ